MAAERQRVALAWFSRSEWQQLRKIADDADDLEETYEEWREQADRTLNGLLESGVLVEEFSIRVGELADWCKQQGRPVDGSARADFAALKLQQRDSGRAGA